MSKAGVATPMGQLRRELRRMRWPTAPPGLVYRGGPDFVLQHGEEFEPRQLPPEYQHALAGHCYGNAMALAVAHGLAYVEGYALEPDREKVFAHAWNVDAGGLVDATWTGVAAVGQREGRQVLFVGKPGVAYLGVRFHPGRADDATWFGDATILDDDERGYPLFRERWRGEDWSREWEPSPVMLALRAGPGPEGRAILAAARAGM